jgi:DNA-binding IclR family transcriptional regulator
MFELGSKRLAHLDIRKFARPFMRSLAKACSETVHLSLLDGLDVVCIDKLDGPEHIQAYSAIGGRAPAYAVAAGKALLAFETPNYLDRFPAKLKRYTPTTQTSVQTLKSELSEIARQGYATNRGEWRDGVSGVSAPVFNGFDKPIAALAISGLLERLTIKKMTEFAPLVLQAAQELSRSMGYRGAFFENHI